MAENTFDRFAVFFAGDTVFLDGTAFPLGQLTTDILNLDSEVLTEIDRCVDDCMSATWMLLQEKKKAPPTPRRRDSTLSGI